MPTTGDRLNKATFVATLCCLALSLTIGSVHAQQTTTAVPAATTAVVSSSTTTADAVCNLNCTETWYKCELDNDGNPGCVRDMRIIAIAILIAVGAVIVLIICCACCCCRDPAPARSGRAGGKAGGAYSDSRQTTVIVVESSERVPVHIMMQQPHGTTAGGGNSGDVETVMVTGVSRSRPGVVSVAAVAEAIGAARGVEASRVEVLLHSGGGPASLKEELVDPVGSAESPVIYRVS